MPTRNDRGIALVLALFLTAALSVIAASLMFLSQTETYASMNYRMMSQARFAGEAGIQKAADYLLDQTRYALPGTITDPLTNYDRTKSPVLCIAGCANLNQPVVLSATTTVASNYPVAAVRTAFNAAAQGPLSAGFASLTYGSYATLVSMQTFDSYGGGQAVVQTWEITGIGSLGGTRNASVQVSSTVETPKVAANSYAAFATANTCDAIYLHGSVSTDSYDSTQGPPSGAGNSSENTDGDVGTNGNVHLQGAASVAGNVYTPRTGVGSCTAGAVTGLTGGSPGQLVALPAAVAYPTPTFNETPATLTWMEATTANLTSALLNTGANDTAKATAACTALGLTYGTNATTPVGNCDLKTATGLKASDGAAGTFTNIVVNGNLPDVAMPNVVIGSGITLTLTGAPGAGQTVNVNSIQGNGALAVDANLMSNNGDSVVLKINGLMPDGTEMTDPINFGAMTWKQNSAGHGYDASALQLVYGGTQTLSMPGGNSGTAATIYAPNATFAFQGTQDWYGSILAKSISAGGNFAVHYDRRLERDYYVAGHPMLGAFTWKRD